MNFVLTNELNEINELKEINKLTNNLKSSVFWRNISKDKRNRILRKLTHYMQLESAIKKANMKRGANIYAIEYMKQNLDKYVKVKDVTEYCNKKTQEKTGQPLGDPPRSFEILRKDKLPLEWSEIQYKKFKYVKYSPNLKKNVTDEIINSHKHKSDGFSKVILEEKLKSSNYKCAITGIPQENGGLAGDHFIPKEKGGESVVENCVILNKILNEKKNKKMPVEWFCETLLTNFMNICKNVGILHECKSKLIKFIEDF